MYTNGPAGGGGVRAHVTEVIGIASALIPRDKGNVATLSVFPRDDGIANTGAVVAPDAVEALVDPLVRGTGRTLTRGSGHGLGLTTAHDGTLTLHPQPGRRPDRAPGPPASRVRASTSGTPTATR